MISLNEEWDKPRKLSVLIDRYYNLTPLGLALKGQRIINQIDDICGDDDELRKAVANVMAIRNGSKRKA